MFFSKKSYLINLIFITILILTFQIKDAQASKSNHFYLIYQKGIFKGLSKAFLQENKTDCETLIISNENKSLKKYITKSTTFFSKDDKNNFSKHIFETKTSSGKIKCTIENNKKMLKCSSILPNDKTKIKNIKKISDFSIYDNNIFFHLENIIDKFFLKNNKLSGKNKNLEFKKTINIFIPAFLKFKKLYLEKISEKKILLKIDSQIIYAITDGNKLKKLLFPFQMFEILSCNKATYDYALSQINKNIPFNIVSPEMTGPDEIILYNLNTSNPDSLGSSFYKSSYSKKTSTEYFKLSINKNLLKKIKKDPLYQSIIEKQSLNSVSESFRPAWGLIITGYSKNKVLFIQKNWKEFLHPVLKIWLPLERKFEFNPTRYIRISDYPKKITPHIKISTEWNNNPWLNKNNYQMSSIKLPNSFFSISINEKNIGVAAFLLKREIDFTKRIDRITGNSTYFYSLGSLTEDGRKKRDKYQSTFALNSSSNISGNKFNKISIKTVTNELGKISHTFIKDGTSARLEYFSDKSQKKSQLKINEYNIVLNPLDILHWQLLILNTYGIDKKEKEYIFTAVNPLSSKGKGLLTGLDISFQKKDNRLTAYSRLYNMIFDIDPSSLLIKTFKDNNSRFTGKSCDYDTFKKIADKTGKSAVFNTLKIGLQK